MIDDHPRACSRGHHSIRRKRATSVYPEPPASGADASARAPRDSLGLMAGWTMRHVPAWGSAASWQTERSLTMASASDLRSNVLLRSEQSAGHVSVMENVVSAGSGG